MIRFLYRTIPVSVRDSTVPGSPPGIPGSIGSRLPTTSSAAGPLPGPVSLPSSILEVGVLLPTSLLPVGSPHFTVLAFVGTLSLSVLLVTNPAMIFRSWDDRLVPRRDHQSYLALRRGALPGNVITL